MNKRVIGAALAGLTLLSGAGACTSGPDSAGGPAGQHADQNSPTALLNLGIQQGTAGNLDSAKATFQRVVSFDKNNKYAWFNLGVMAQSKGATDEANKDYDTAIAADPNFTSALYNKAILMESSNVDGAVALYQKILTLNAKASTTFLRLGLLLDKKGDHAGALANFHSAIALDGTLIGVVPATYQDQVRGK